VTILAGSAAAVDTLVRSHADLAAAVHGSRLLPVTVLAPDAALVPFLTALPARCLAGNGQYGCDETCVLVPREQHAETVEAVTAKVAALSVGDPREPGVQIGPVLDDWHVEA